MDREERIKRVAMAHGVPESYVLKEDAGKWYFSSTTDIHNVYCDIAISEDVLIEKLERRYKLYEPSSHDLMEKLKSLKEYFTYSTENLIKLAVERNDVLRDIVIPLFNDLEATLLKDILSNKTLDDIIAEKVEERLLGKMEEVVGMFKNLLPAQPVTASIEPLKLATLDESTTPVEEVVKSFKEIATPAPTTTVLTPFVYHPVHHKKEIDLNSCSTAAAAITYVASKGTATREEVMHTLGISWGTMTSLVSTLVKHGYFEYENSYDFVKFVSFSGIPYRMVSRKVIKAVCDLLRERTLLQNWWTDAGTVSRKLGVTINVAMDALNELEVEKYIKRVDLDTRLPKFTKRDFQYKWAAQ